MEFDVQKVFQVLQTLYHEVWILEDWLRSISASVEGNPLVQDSDSDSFKQFVAGTVVGISAGVKPPPRVDYNADHSHQRELLLRVITKIRRHVGANKNVLTLGFGVLSDDYNGRIGSLPDMEYQYPNSNYSQLHRSVWGKLLSRIGDSVMMYLLESTSVFLFVSPSSYIQITGFPAHNLPCFNSRQEMILKSVGPTQDSSRFGLARKDSDQVSRKRKRSSDEGIGNPTGKRQRTFQSIHQAKTLTTTTTAESMELAGKLSNFKKKPSLCTMSESTAVQVSKPGNTVTKVTKKTRRGKRKTRQTSSQNSITCNQKYRFSRTLSWTRSLYGKDLREIWPKQHTDCFSSSETTSQSQSVILFREMFAHFIGSADGGKPSGENTAVGEVINSNTKELQGERTGLNNVMETVKQNVIPQLEDIIKKHRTCPFRPLLNSYCPITKMNMKKKSSRKPKAANKEIEKSCSAADKLLNASSREATMRQCTSQTSTQIIICPLCRSSYTDTDVHKCARKKISDGSAGPSRPCQRSKCPSFRMSVLLEENIHPRKVFLFLRQICLRVIPRELLGCKYNWNRFLKNIKTLLSLGRYDKMNTGQLLFKMKVNSVHWLPKSSNHNTRVALFSTFIYWLFNDYILVILKAYFYITDTTRFRNKLFFYRKPVWHRLKWQAQKDYLSKGILSSLSQKEVKKLVSEGNSLGVSPLRFLPKTSSLRPIVNMGRRGFSASDKPGKELSVNCQLSDVFQVLKFEKSENPSVVGRSVFGVDDIYKQWKSFVTRRQKECDERPLYFVSVDIKDCYDSINQHKLYSVISDILKKNNEEEYVIRKYVKIVPAAGKLKRIFCRHVTRLHDFEPDFSQFTRALCKGGNCHRAVVTDQILHLHVTPEEVLQKLSAHLFNNVIQIGLNFYHQKSGISQGSVLSSLLCSIYYGSMEREVVSTDTEEVMMRMVDDWLFVTPHKHRAQAFLQTMTKGVAEYNCIINSEKTLTNFEAADGCPSTSCIAKEELFPWCGLLFDTDTLSITVDYTRYQGLSVGDTVTFDVTQNPGVTLRKKMFDAVRSRCHGLFVDPQINSSEVVVLNVYRIFLLLAFKFHSMMKKLPDKHRANDNPQFFLGIITDLPPFFYSQTTLKLKKVSQSTCTTWCVSQDAMMWLCCEAFCCKLGSHQSEYHCLLTDLKKLQKKMASEMEGEEKQLVCDKSWAGYSPKFLVIQN